MKSIALWLCILATSTSIEAGQSGFYVEAEVFAFDDADTTLDYAGLSPFGIYSIKYKSEVADNFTVSVGYRHQSSAGYKEEGNGFNGPFMNFEVKLFGTN